MEDTFSSWFAVMELHTWLLACRLMCEGDEGRLVRNSMIKAMWEDVETRSKKLEGALASARKHQVGELNQIFQANLFGYDEGLLTDDRILAGKYYSLLSGIRLLLYIHSIYILSTGMLICLYR